jgi:hypothetical protein
MGANGKAATLALVRGLQAIAAGLPTPAPPDPQQQAQREVPNSKIYPHLAMESTV